MEEEALRRAWRRLADPFGTPPRAAILGLSLAIVAAYAGFALRGQHRSIVLGFAVALLAFFALRSLLARRRAARAGAGELRRDFLERGRARVRSAAGLPLRAALWLGVGAWAGLSLLGWVDFPSLTGELARLFLACISLLLAAHPLLEWLVETPRLRRDLAANEESAPAGVACGRGNPPANSPPAGA